tara:strand:- start:74 stop:391 length:318 start_codon:yes stop_codon:yes gene_type:complete
MSFEGDVKKVMDSLETLADDLHLNVEIELGVITRASTEAREELENKVGEIKDIEDKAEDLASRTTRLIKDIHFIVSEYSEIEELVGKAQDIEEIQLDLLDSSPDE